LNKARIAAFVSVLSIFLATAVYGENYIRYLVGDLLAIGYPISKEDVIALDNIGMRFDIPNRLDVLKKILSDRDKIHGIKDASYFTKTEAICNALHLLDEHNLPEADELVATLSHQQGWEKREKGLLSYMAAKRHIDYKLNLVYLLSALAEYSGNEEMHSKVEITTEILDLCNCLSYLADLFNHTGNVQILNTLIDYAARAYGYPGEYASRLLVDMFLQQPDAFISVLAKKDDQTRKTIIDSMVFGIWNNQQKSNVLNAIKKLNLTNEQEKSTISIFVNEISLKFANNSTKDKDLNIDQHSKK
jgi:hypothetical protein